MNSIRRAGGLVAEDPLRNAPVGTQLNICASLFACSPTADQLSSIANWEIFEGAVVAFHFAESGRQHILGSGVSVAPGVIMAARHVVEAQEEKLRRGDQELMCSGIMDGGIVLWRCRGVTLVGNTDVAFLMVEAASALPNLLRQVTLTTRMPHIGEKVVIVGVKHHADSPTPITDEVNMSVMSAVGEVTARYERRRDSVLLPHPCFEVSCAASGGMSGGPAFDKDGFLLGLITSSVESDTGGPTFLSLPWPAFGETINPIWPSGFYKKPTTLLDIDRRVCGIHRVDALEIQMDASSRQKAITYRHWDT